MTGGFIFACGPYFAIGICKKHENQYSGSAAGEILKKIPINTHNFADVTIFYIPTENL